MAAELLRCRTMAGSRRQRRAPADRDWTAEQQRFLAAIAAESHFHRVFDGLGDIFFFAKNLAGETMFFSRGILPHIGLEREDQMLGATDDQLTPGPFADRFKEEDREVIETRQPLLGVIDVWFDEVGLPDWYETNKYPIFDRDNTVMGVMGTLRRFQGAVPPGPGDVRIRPALVILREGRRRFPPLAQLADACGLSGRQLQRSFHQVFGFGPRTYWMKGRIRLACMALRNGIGTIATIANELGFCDQSNFTLHFRRHTGQTPAAYRQAAGHSGGVAKSRRLERVGGSASNTVPTARRSFRIRDHR